MTWTEGAALAALGLVAGWYGTMVGLGGGFMLVPAFLFMGFDPRTAAGTSMAVVLANSFSGTLSYLRQKRVDVPTGVLFAVAGMPGAWLGAAVDQWIPQRLFSISFAALLLWVGARLLLAPSAPRAVELVAPHREDEPRPGLIGRRPGFITRDFIDAKGNRHTYRYHAAAGAAISLFGGFVASAFGIGGGLIQVPSMIFLFGFPAHVATATSHFIIAVTALVGTASHAIYGDVRWAQALIVAAGAVVGAQVGAFTATRVAPAPLMRLLAAAVLLTAGKLLWDALFSSTATTSA
jgi:uncharacterized protein